MVLMYFSIPARGESVEDRDDYDSEKSFAENEGRLIIDRNQDFGGWKIHDEDEEEATRTTSGGKMIGVNSSK